MTKTPPPPDEDANTHAYVPLGPVAGPEAVNPLGDTSAVGGASAASEALRRRALRGIVTVGLRGVGIRLVGLVGYLFVARLLSPADLGIAAFGLTITFAAHLLADAGIGGSLIRSSRTPARQDYAAAMGFQLLVLSIVTAGFCVWAAVSGSEVIVVTALFIASLPMLAFRVPATIALERELRFGPSVIADLVEVLVFNAWIITGVLLGGGVYALATGAVLRTIVGTTLLNHLSPIGWLRPTLDFGRIRHLLGFGIAYQASSVVAAVRDQIFNLGTAAVAGYGVLGLWSVANRVVGLPILVFESLWRVSFPAFARMRESGEDMAIVLERGVSRSALLAGFMLTPVTVCAPAALTALLGNQWEEASLIFPYVFLGLMISLPVAVVANGYLYAVGDAVAVLRCNLALTATAVAVGAVALPLLGYVGLGLAQLAASIVDGVLLSRAVRRHSGVSIHRRGLPALVAFIAGVASGLLLLDVLGRGAIGTVVGTIAAGCAFGLVSYAIDRTAARDGWQLVRTLPARLKSPAET